MRKTIGIILFILVGCTKSDVYLRIDNKFLDNWSTVTSDSIFSLEKQNRTLLKEIEYQNIFFFTKHPYNARSRDTLILLLQKLPEIFTSRRLIIAEYNRGSKIDIYSILVNNDYSIGYHYKFGNTVNLIEKVVINKSILDDFILHLQNPRSIMPIKDSITGESASIYGSLVVSDFTINQTQVYPYLTNNFKDGPFHKFINMWK